MMDRLEQMENVPLSLGEVGKVANRGGMERIQKVVSDVTRC